VELYHGPTSGGYDITRGKIVRMAVDPPAAGASGAAPASKDAHTWQYSGQIATVDSGAHAFAVRVLPYNEGMTHPYETSLLRWA
jgi:hypothetical protein